MYSEDALPEYLTGSFHPEKRYRQRAYRNQLRAVFSADSENRSFETRKTNGQTRTARSDIFEGLSAKRQHGRRENGGTSLHRRTNRLQTKFPGKYQAAKMVQRKIPHEK